MRRRHRASYRGRVEPPGELPARELRVFLALAEDPHFGRVAERLFVSQPYVSRALASLERKVGGSLLDRTSRQLTQLGSTLLADARPAYDALGAALERARAEASGGRATLRLGCTASVDSQALVRLAAAYELGGRTLRIEEVASGSPFRLLRDGDLDVIVWPRSGSDPELVFGPTVEFQSATLAMRAGHPLAERDAVTLDEAAGYGVIVPSFDGQPEGFIAESIPAQAVSGVPERPDGGPGMFHQAAYQLARTDRLFPMSSGVARAYAHRSDLVFRPIADQPPVELALIWLRRREDERIRALAEAADELAALPTTSPVSAMTLASSGSHLDSA